MNTQTVRVSFNYNHGGALKLSDLDLSNIPAKGDIVRISGVRHIVRKREFWIDHGMIDYVELHLDEAN